MKKAGIISLGCPKNRVDSEHILGLLKRIGYKVVNSTEDADIVFINTCGFITDAKKESIETILENIGTEKKVVVTGCLVERYLKDLKKEIPEVDLWIPIKDYGIFATRLKEIDPEITFSNGLDYHYRLISSGPFTSYLRIGEGCSNHCSYCAIPLIRGEYVSRPLEEIVEEAKHLASIGIKELVVLEQDTSKYGLDFKNGTNIVVLLKKLLEIKDFDYIRLLYLYPDEVTDELIELIGSNPRLTSYFDIPIQHSEDHILKAMNRRGNKQDLLNLFSKIRNKVDNAIIRTTIMVGFPGETEEDVDNLIEFMKEVKFDHVGAFAYSREEDTPSYDFSNQIDEETKQARLDRVMKAQQSISYRNNKGHVGKIMEGLIFAKEHNHYLFRSYYNAPDNIDGKIIVESKVPLSIGQKVKVKITEAFVYDLIGEAII